MIANLLLRLGMRPAHWETSRGLGSHHLTATTALLFPEERSPPVVRVKSFFFFFGHAKKNCNLWDFKFLDQDSNPHRSAVEAWSLSQ